MKPRAFNKESFIIRKNGKIVAESVSYEEAKNIFRDIKGGTRSMTPIRKHEDI